MDFVSTLERTSFPAGQQYGSQGRVQQRRGSKRGDQEYHQQDQSFLVPKQAGHSYNITCQWEPFREQILTQWNRLTGREVDEVGPNRSKIAMLIENKYGIAAHLVENYLRNFERTLPLI